MLYINHTYSIDTIKFKHSLDYIQPIQIDSK